MKKQDNLLQGLFVVFHGFSAHSGISKKIRAQCRALTHDGVAVQLCYTEVTAAGQSRRMIGEQLIRDFGCGLWSKIAKRLYFSDLTDYILQNNIRLLYVRYDHNASPVLILWLRRLRRAGVRIVLEIPTYPYDREYRGQGLQLHLRLLIDRCFRRYAMHYVDRIVTFSDEVEIFGCPTIRISNGIDFDQIPLRQTTATPTNTLRLLGVANIHLWHGFDRVIAGLAEYYQGQPTRDVHFTIVGDGDPAILESYRCMIDCLHLQTHVSLLGALSGEALDAAFDSCELGIASLGRHRSGITKIKTLKNREYAARGIPFVYSETDTDFDDMPYVLKVPAEDKAVDINSLIRFHDLLRITPTQIRASILGELSWERQMQKVLDEL